MEYIFQVWENKTKVVYEGKTSGKGTRKEQEEEARRKASKNGYKTRLDPKYSLSMRATSLF